MKTQLLLIILIALSISACKTQEDIRRERTMENINEKIAQTQQNTAGVNGRFQNLEDQISKLTGQVEELSHSKGQDAKDTSLLRDRLNAIEEVNKKQSETIKIMADKLNEQSKYIEQVIKSLNELSEKKDREPEVKKKAIKEDDSEKEVNIKNGINKYKAQDLAGAKTIFEDLLENSKLKKKDKASALYYIGLIELKEKRYDDAKIYFSRLFTEIPDSTYGASALLNLAKCFYHLKAKEEAKQTIEELVSRYPKSKEVAEASKLKAKL